MFHSFAGHLARGTTGLPSQAFRIRSLQWWRAFQSVGAFLHPQRFKVWRWGAPLTEYYGPTRSFFVDEDIGWMGKALDRAVWDELVS